MEGYSEKQIIMLELTGVEIISALRKGEINIALGVLLAFRDFFREDGSEEDFTAGKKKCIAKIFEEVMRMLYDKMLEDKTFEEIFRNICSVKMDSDEEDEE